MYHITTASCAFALDDRVLAVKVARDMMGQVRNASGLIADFWPPVPDEDLGWFGIEDEESYWLD